MHRRAIRMAVLPAQPPPAGNLGYALKVMRA
jgi:hypothetical protein